MNKQAHIFLALSLVLLISACGWHLRGLKPLPTNLKELHLISVAPESFNESLKRSLKFTGVRLIAKFDDTLSVLQIKSFKIERREHTVSASGQIGEYQLDAHLVAEIINQKKQTSQEININEQRFFTNDLSNQAGTAADEALQRENMQQQLINKLIIQLGKVNLDSASKPKVRPWFYAQTS